MDSNVETATRFTLSPRLLAGSRAEPFDPQLEPPAGAVPPPATRGLAVYTQDPSTPRADAAVAELKIAYEPLAPGPTGRIVKVIDRNETRSETYRPLDLDRLGPGHPSGLKPGTATPLFAQQMTYAVAMSIYERFHQALGRTPDLAIDAVPGSDDTDDRSVRLRIYPHAFEEDNAFYDRERGALYFGYFRASNTARGLNQPGGIVFTALSHDVICHEMTHALLDGMRPNFFLPSNPDVVAFHEGFADLVGLFQRFSYRDLVRRALQKANGELSSSLLTDFARQFGEASGDGRGALRSALLADGGPETEVAAEYLYNPEKEGHALGAVLVAAVFDAFRWVFTAKTQPLRRLIAIRGGEPPTEYYDLLAKEAARLAGQFLNIVIRAVDYCPPVDLSFGDYLRALLTADHDLVADDDWGYREALVQGFRRYGIQVGDVPDLSEEALLWQPPERPFPLIPGLAFSDLCQRHSPGFPADPAEMKRQGEALGAYVTEPARAYCFGLAAPRYGNIEWIEPAVVQSIRTLRRIGPDNTVSFDLVAEITQRRRTDLGSWFYGGSTIIIDARGRIRYAVSKQVGSRSREEANRAYLERSDPLHARFFTEDAPPISALLRRLHAPRRGSTVHGPTR